MEIVQDAQRNHLAELLALQSKKYRMANEERGKLSQEETETNDEFPVWAELELLWSYISGYASQIVHSGVIQEPANAIEHLQKLNLFNVERFRAWYFSSEDDYPHLRELFNTTNYIRLLVSECLNNT
ncbi:MAG TPA: hypothetical protein VHO84_00985 [Syntrophorhabdaceae bacterium]|nr:hypothetical protein [Syntrophorhabdaceae bacterium]HEX3052875.1 hypothetical protein [Aggregatilineaceae bacterium]